MTKCCECPNVWNTFMNDRMVRECHSCHKKVVLISTDINVIISPVMDKKIYKILNKTWNRCIKNKYDYIEMTI